MKDRYLINSILRACNILKSFSREKPTFKVSELASQLRLDRSSVYRILLTLEKSGLVERDEKTGEYSLGVDAFEIGSAYLGKVDFVQISKPIMSDLARQLQEAVHLAVLSGTEIIYLDKIDSPRAIGVTSKVGQRAPAYCTSLGKLLLSFLPEEERSRVIEKIQFKPYTKNTITSKRRLIEELAWIRKKGYALDHREHEEDVECIAAPIRNHLGISIAGISVSGYQRKVNTPLEKKIAEQVMKAAAIISSKLGYSESK